MKSFWIIGAGRFGKKAVQGIHSRWPRAHIVVVDRDPVATRQMEGEGISLECRDGIDFLWEALGRGEDPDWILPVIPVHLAYEWVRRRLPSHGRRTQIPVPESVATLLPNPIGGGEGQLYVSYADFICPDDCPEPGDVCTCTGQPRLGILWQVLKRLTHEDYISVVVQSRQLLPGVGGLRPADLFAALAAVRRAPGPVLFSTACKCHGVVHALSPPA
ncbi:MAG: potassium transporter [Desulfobacterales bacterium]|nr:potassium transporter [Desulfobacterales bacterium]